MRPKNPLGTFDLSEFNTCRFLKANEIQYSLTQLNSEFVTRGNFDACVGLLKHRSFPALPQECGPHSRFLFNLACPKSAKNTSVRVGGISFRTKSHCELFVEVVEAKDIFELIARMAK